MKNILETMEDQHEEAFPSVLPLMVQGIECALRDRITELEAQLSDLEKLKLDISNALQAIVEYDQENASLEAQLADAKQVANDCRIVADNAILEALAAKKDAARYQWLRDPCSGAENFIMYERGDFGKGLKSGAMLDEAADAAICKTNLTKENP